MKLIPLTQEKFAKVDDEDYEFLNKYKWNCRRSPHTYYAITNFRINGKPLSIRMHWIVLPVKDKNNVVDHINHDGLDNQKKNLRECTQFENAQNKTSAKKSTSKYLGVSWYSKLGRWKAQIQINSKRIHIGYYYDEIEAAKAYDESAKSHRGQFANLNFKETINETTNSEKQLIGDTQ